jgi:hypothetical protein
VWTKEIDRKLLILHVSYEFYQKNHLVEIRRARLRELCDDRLNQETDGLQDSFGGGSFEWCLKELEKLGLFRVVQKNLKETVIVLNINRIEHFIQRGESRSSGSSLDRAGKKVIETNIEDSILEEIIEEVYDKIMDRVVEIKYNSKPPESYHEIRNLIAKIMANMMSRAFDISVLYDPGSKMQPNKEFIIHVITPVLKMIEHNMEAPFKITIDYKGISMPSKQVLPRYEPAMDQLINDCFIRWLKSAYDFTISEEDKIKLTGGKVKFLSEPVLGYYKIFGSSMYEYLNLLLKKGHQIYESN